jgi:hypothetical protein
MARRRQMHVFRPLWGDEDICEVCTGWRDARQHQVPPPTDRPAIKRTFNVGERVRRRTTKFDVIGTVIEEVIDPGNFAQGSVRVKFDDSTYTWFQHYAFDVLERVETPPQFTTVEEADAWLEAHSR